MEEPVKHARSGHTLLTILAFAMLAFGLAQKPIEDRFSEVAPELDVLVEVVDSLAQQEEQALDLYYLRSGVSDVVNSIIYEQHYLRAAIPPSPGAAKLVPFTLSCWWKERENMTLGEVRRELSRRIGDATICDTEVFDFDPNAMHDRVRTVLFSDSVNAWSLQNYSLWRCNSGDVSTRCLRLNFSDRRPLTLQVREVRPDSVYRNAYNEPPSFYPSRVRVSLMNAGLIDTDRGDLLLPRSQAIWSDLRDMDIIGARAYLQRESEQLRERGRSAVTLPGSIEIESNLLTIFGPMVLIFVLVYLLLHVDRLGASSDDQVRTIANFWYLLYPGQMMASAAAVVTIAILPILACAILLWKGSVPFGSRFVWGLLFEVALVALGGFVLRGILVLRRRAQIIST